MSGTDTSDPAKGYTTTPHPAESDRAVFLGDVKLDNLHTAFLAMAAEMWSMRRRQKVVETLLSTRGVVTTQMIEAFRPSPELEAQWHVERDQFIRTVYDPLQRREGIDYHSSLSGPTGGRGA